MYTLCRIMEAVYHELLKFEYGDIDKFSNFLLAQ